MGSRRLRALEPPRSVLRNESAVCKVDPLDQRLIALLRHNARQSISELASGLRISRATARSRMERLEKIGEIIGYTAIVRAEALESPVRGIMMVEIAGNATDRVIRALSGLAEVSMIHTTNGRWDLIVELGTASLPEFDSVLRRIRLIPGVVRSDTSLLLTTPRSNQTRL